MNRYFIELAYDGNKYHGWQIQPGAPSVQEELNRALSTIMREKINVVGAGRTDTGVHASFYVAHFDSQKPITLPEQLVYKLNRLQVKTLPYPGFIKFLPIGMPAFPPFHVLINTI